MTIYNREDSRTVLPQLEKQFNNRIDAVDKTLDEIKAELMKPPYIPSAIIYINNSTAVANSNISNTQVYNLPTAFTGNNYSHQNNSVGDFFDNDQNGFRVLKKGFYKLEVSANFNGVAQSSWGIQFYNWTDSTAFGGDRFGYTPTGYASISHTWSGIINADKTIVVRCERYSTVTANSKWRPASINFSITLLNEIT